MCSESKLSWFKLFTFIITTVIALLGLYFNNYFASQRDFNNKLRDIRLTYLIDAYRKLSDSSQRIPNDIYFSQMETAISDIQLFGSESQINKAIIFLNEYKNEGKGKLDPLLNDLKNDLRKELKLKQINNNVHWFRPSGVPDLEEIDLKEYLKNKPKDNN